MSILADLPNTLTRYYPELREAARKLENDHVVADWFEVGWELPEPDGALEEFFAVTGLRALDLGTYRGHPLLALDLTRNPGTHTTKTFGSSIIVARAVEHTRATGEPVLLVTPSAANKAVALRDAVLRAYRSGLATPDQLRVVTIVPKSSLPKIRASELDADPRLAAMNPMGVFGGTERETVKLLATDAIRALRTRENRLGGFRVWYTLNPDNYRLADLVRSLFEYDHLPPRRERWHTHAVSSAYGFLGHDLGMQIARARGTDCSIPQRYLLVQHFETPDLVEAVTGIHVADAVARGYQRSEDTGLLTARLDTDPRLPRTATAPDERLERTFYTRTPPTTDDVQRLIKEHGGDGMVVSLSECIERYGAVRDRFERAGLTRLPADPRLLLEWAGVMAAVAALGAVDRGIVPEGAEILVHCSGAYGETDYDRIDLGPLAPVGSPDDVSALFRSATAPERA